jgi:hypothetical protein
MLKEITKSSATKIVLPLELIKSFTAISAAFGKSEEEEKK